MPVTAVLDAAGVEVVRGPRRDGSLNTDGVQRYAMELGDLDTPSMRSGLGAFVGYGVILLVMFVALFLIPYALFLLL